jgi:hypothetical protein
VNSASSVLKHFAVGLLSSVLWIAASAQVEVLSNGNVGIGTASPGASLDVQIPGNTLGVRIQNDAATTARLLAVSAGNSAWSNGNGVAQFTVGSATSTGKVVSIVNNGTGDSLYINHAGASGNGLVVTGGKVGFGTTSPQGMLHLSGPDVVGLRVESINGSYPLIDLKSNGKTWMLSKRTAAEADRLAMHFHDGTAYSGEFLTLATSGNVGIGTTNPGYKLEVAGSVRATSFISNTTTYADFVFAPDYDLPALSEVEAHIAEHGHLPGIPSEAEARAHGIDLAAMQVKLLQKVEEMTLHLIAQEKRLAEVERENATLRRRLLQSGHE